MAERLLLRAQASEPDGPKPRIANRTYYAPWSERLEAVRAGHRRLGRFDDVQRRAGD